MVSLWLCIKCSKIQGSTIIVNEILSLINCPCYFELTNSISTVISEWRLEIYLL